MYNRRRRIIISKEELLNPSVSMIGVRQRNSEIIESTNPSSNRIARRKKKNPWPKNETGSISPSWDNHSRATSSSWPEDIEEAATRKVLNLWYAIERSLYKEDGEVPLGDILDECIQWRTQIPHFRVVGTKKNLEITENDSESGWNGECKSHSSTNRHVSNDNTRNNLQEKDLDNASNEQHQNSEQKEKVIIQVLQSICDKLERGEETADDKNEIESTSKNLDEVLTITPAPTYGGGKNLKSKKINTSHSRMSSANKNESFQVTERKININASKKSRKNAKNAVEIVNSNDVYDEDDSEVDESLQYVRNKPGTVFREKIVVSPVPYAVTTRESFCTLKTTPIRYAGHLLELSSPHELNRNINSASKAKSAHRVSQLRVPQRYSGWQSSIYPMAWPKNVRLAPIDQSRLPSSKKRSSTISPSIAQRNRNSLSPISRPLRITSAITPESNVNDDDLLKIHGKQIVTSSVKSNLLKTGPDGRPRIPTDLQKK